MNFSCVIKLKLVENCSTFLGRNISAEDLTLHSQVCHVKIHHGALIKQYCSSIYTGEDFDCRQTVILHDAAKSSMETQLTHSCKLINRTTLILLSEKVA